MRTGLLVFAGAAALAAQSLSFPSAETCRRCHAVLPAPETATNAVSAYPSPHTLWSGTMMAHASRDPYWKARVRWEAAQMPGAEAVIEDHCLRCHAPAQQYAQRPGKLRLDQVAGVGLEGVTCTVCHQIQPANLGRPETFSANFRIGAEGIIYGPHADPFSMPMRMMAGVTPRESKHILESALCATCHTVVTESRRPDGVERGEFVEQGPFLEWRESDYARNEISCQACHLPLLRDAAGEPVPQYIAHNPMGRFFPPTRPRTPFGQHVFLGGNFQVAALLGLERTAERARQNLSRAVDLTATAEFRGGTLAADVTVLNLTGHKLPTGFPSRRLWLHLTARDAAGKVVFESGAWDGVRGEISGSAGFETHYTVITGPRQTQIYEAEYADEAGRPTLSLTRAAAHRKDNRILPSGFAAAGAPPAIRPEGVTGDPDFGDGRDTTAYRIPVGGRPATVEIEVLFQNIKSRDAQALGSVSHPDIEDFLARWRQHWAPAQLARLVVPVR